MCYSLLYNAPRMLPAGSYRPAKSWVRYTTSCNTQSNAPEYGQDQHQKHVELIIIINKQLFLHLFGVDMIYIICPLSYVSSNSGAIQYRPMFT